MSGRRALVLAAATTALLRGTTGRADEPDRSPWIDVSGLPPITHAPDPEGDDAQYRALTAHDPHYFRLFLEEMGLLGLGVVEYWLDRKRAVTNFDYPSLVDRFTFKAWRLDNNGFQINFFGHPMNGMTFHMVARANGLSLPGSILAGFATSMTWEFGWEFREKRSRTIFVPMNRSICSEFSANTRHRETRSMGWPRSCVSASTSTRSLAICFSFATVAGTV